MIKTMISKNILKKLVISSADGIEDFPSEAEAADLLVIKTHIPSQPLLFLTAFTRGTILITVREPRDSIVSLMRRFGHRFDVCLEEVGRSAAH